jgi:hypothetical protein
MDAVESGMAKSEAAVCVNLFATRCRVASEASLECLAKPSQEKLRLRLDQRSLLVKAVGHHPFNAIVRYSSSAHARRPAAAGVCAGLFGSQQRQQRIGQDEGGEDQGYVEAIFDIQEALQVKAVVKVQVVVRPPGDQEPAY